MPPQKISPKQKGRRIGALSGKFILEKTV